MSREKRKAKKEAEKRLSTRQFIGAKEITDYSLVTYGQGELVYFIVKPTNISVLSESSVGARIYALMTVLKGVAEIEMLCLNSRESFEAVSEKSDGAGRESSHTPSFGTGSDPSGPDSGADGDSP